MKRNITNIYEKTGNTNMIIKTEGHSMEHNIWLVASLFFRDEESVFIYSYLNTDNARAASKARVEYEDNIYTAEYSVAFYEGDEREKNRISAAVCGMAVWKAICKIRKKRLPWGVMTGIRPAKIIRQMLDAGIEKKEIKRRIREMYGAEEKKIELAFEVAKNELGLIKKNKPDDIALYIGIPFCPSRCLYCSFVSTDIRHTKKYLKPYLDCLIKEIELSADMAHENGKHISSIYIGGGTPTTLSEREMERLLLCVEKNFDTKSLYEYCIEAGRPDTITYEKLCVMKKYGVTRISINPQSMHEKTLALIGRAHTPDDIKTAFELARRADFDVINADVIAGLPGESEQDFLYTLKEIDSFKPENITVHTLSIKRGSTLHQRVGAYEMSDADTVYNMLDTSYDFMKETNRFPYYMYRQKNMLGNLENVGYSIKGCESIYNVNIMEEVQSVLALGGGGASKIYFPRTQRIERIFNFKAPIEYIARFDEIIERKKEFFNLVANS